MPQALLGGGTSCISQTRSARELLGFLSNRFLPPPLLAIGRIRNKDHFLASRYDHMTEF